MSGRRTLPESYGPASPPTPVPEVLPPEAAPSVRGVRVLIAAAQRPGRDRLASVLAEAGARCLQTGDPAEIDSLVRAHRVEVVLVPCSGGAVEALDLCARLAAGPANPSVVIAPESPTLDVALAAVRAGASDLVAWGAPAGELITRISAAAGSARARRAEARRVRRLRRLCRRLNSARREVVGQIESLCDDLAGAYERMSDQMTRVAISSEFNSLVRQELDVEGLLRTVLEYALAKVGPTNAAIFLPSSTGEHTLGAYVNYDVPRDAAEVLLDHLTTVIPHRFEGIARPVHLSSDRALRGALGEDAHWLEGRGVVVLPCPRDGRTMAVVALFRDGSTPFTPAHLESCEIIADLFGQQMARVIHVHHRHLPTDEWGMPGDPIAR